MRILALDTALGACSVAILKEGAARAHRFEPLTRGHAEALFAMIAAVETEAGQKASDMDRLAVTIGPGTFTGLRVGLSAARGMALGAGLPLIGITTLQAVAANVASASLKDGDVIATIFDAKRGEVYHQNFTKDLSPLSDPAIMTVEECAALLDRQMEKHSGDLILVGSGAPLMAAACHGTPRVADVSEQPDALNVARLAAAVDDPLQAPPQPLYLRKPDAKLPSKSPLQK